MVAGLIRVFGSSSQAFTDRYFKILTWVFGALLVGGFILTEFVLRAPIRPAPPHLGDERRGPY